MTAMADPKKYLDLTESSPSIQTHLGVMQSVIQRMAGNSAACKTWCVTIVAAILVLVADKGNPRLVWLAILPVMIFGALDVYYLALEKGFKKSYDAFIGKVHRDKLVAEDLYSIKPSGNRWRLQFEALTSFSVWGFYPPLIGLAAVTLALISK
jgi:hypothetical protein